MVLKSEKEKVKTLLAETIRLLCKNGLNFKTEFSVEALVGITLDKDEEFFLSIKETVKSDIRPQKLDTPKTQKESHHNGNREIKGEPGQHSSCRKRASETVTNVAGSSELPSLSLGDMQEGEQSFWSSVTGSDGEGAGGEGGTSHPSKRTKVEASEDDSNSNVIEIKGEPGSESEEEDGGGGEASQVDQSGADMSGPYTYATPVTSAHEMIGSGMAQVWDQLPPFSSMPGPSGMAAGMSQDGQQQDGALQMASPASSLVNLDNQEEVSKPSTAKTPSRAKLERLANLQRDPFYIPRLMRRILLTKGRDVTPKQVYWNFSYRDRPSVALIHQVMKELADRGLGIYGKNDRKTSFTKHEPWTVSNMLSAYGIDTQKYEKQFYALDSKESQGSYG